MVVNTNLGRAERFEYTSFPSDAVRLDASVIFTNLEGFGLQGNKVTFIGSPEDETVEVGGCTVDIRAGAGDDSIRAVRGGPQGFR